MAKCKHEYVEHVLGDEEQWVFLLHKGFKFRCLSCKKVFWQGDEERRRQRKGGR